MSDFEIVIIANGPGELSALVKPVAEQIKKISPSTRLTIVLTPCQYASGFEEDFIKKHIQPDQIVTANDYKKWLLKGALPKNISFGPKGKVLFMGGDLLHAMIVSKKLNFKEYAYM